MSEELKKQIEWEARVLSQRWPLQKDIQLVYEIYLKGATKYAADLERKDKLIEEMIALFEEINTGGRSYIDNQMPEDISEILERANKK